MAEPRQSPYVWVTWLRDSVRQSIERPVEFELSPVAVCLEERAQLVRLVAGVRDTAACPREPGDSVHQADHVSVLTGHGCDDVVKAMLVKLWEKQILLDMDVLVERCGGRGDGLCHGLLAGERRTQRRKVFAEEVVSPEEDHADLSLLLHPLEYELKHTLVLLAVQGHDVEEHAEQAGVNAHVLASQLAYGPYADALLADHGFDGLELLWGRSPCWAGNCRERLDHPTRRIAEARGHPLEQFVMVPLILVDEAHEEPHELAAGGVGQPHVFDA